MASRSANLLVIFVVAIFAFCFASVFASMTGPISILPNETDNATILDNLSIIPTDNQSNNVNHQTVTQNDDDDSDDSDDKSDVETTKDKSSSSSSQKTSSKNTKDKTKSSDSHIETTTDTSSSTSDVETTTSD